MGFFTNPKKATKAFFKDPAGVVHNDLNRAFGQTPNMTPQQKACQDNCFDLNLTKIHDPSDKNKYLKEFLDLSAYSFCNQKCVE